MYDVIVADCPWGAEDPLKMSKTKRGASSNYNTLSLVELCDMRVRELANDDGCILALWVLGSMLQEGMDVMKAWGFKHKQVFVWVKTKKPKVNKKGETEDLDVNNCLGFGMGRLFRQTHEICLIGTNNTQIYKKLKNKSQRSVCFGINKKHSCKPELLQDYLDLMFPKCKKLEIFARRHRPGWEVIGNEVCNGEDIRASIDNIIKNGSYVPASSTST